MLKDNQIDELIQPIINIFAELEKELIVAVAERFKNYDDISGALEWQLQRLDELGAVNNDLIEIIKKYSGKSEGKIKKLLSDAAFVNLDKLSVNQAFDQGLSAVSYEQLIQSKAIEDIIRFSNSELKKTFSLIKTRALEGSMQSYVNVLNKSYLEVSSGFYSLDESVKRGVREMARKGIAGATYRRPNGKLVSYSIEGVVRRDTISAVHKLANKVAEQSAKDMGTDYVEISAHPGARTHPTNPIANHYGWQGKIYKLSGSEKDYPNLKSSTGYPDDIEGLGGVNCRHRMFPFFPGISTPNPIQYDEKENEKVYKAQQGQRKLEREIRQLKKELAVCKAVGDVAGKQEITAKLNQKYDEINDYCDKNNLRRDYSRELVSEQIYKKTLDKPTKSGIIQSKRNTKIVNDKVTEPMDEERYKSMVSGLEKNNIKVIQATGEDLRYLKHLNAEATYGNGYIMHIDKIPSASAMFEETIHYKQSKLYGELNSSDPFELCIREISANRMLIKNGRAYGFTEQDTNDILNNLKYWENTFKKFTGGEYDESKYYRGVSNHYG